MYLLLLCCLLKVSQYRLALIDTASVHIVKGISQHIHNREGHCIHAGEESDERQGHAKYHIHGTVAAA